MKTRTLRRLRRALKKRSEPSTRDKQRAQVLAELDRASQHVKHLADQAVANLTPKEREILDKHSDRTADRFTRIQRRVGDHFGQRAKETISEVLTRSLDFNALPPASPPPALYPVDPQTDIGPAISPKPTAGALLAAMLQGKKA
jgi:hypothetical protein